MTNTPPDDVETCSGSSATCLKISQVLARIGDKWSVLIIMLLHRRGHRFNELRREIDGISQRMLTHTLRNLERDGLVARKVTISIPPRVDYELTAMGRSLADPVRALGDWAFQHLDAIGTARADFDATGPTATAA